MRRSCSKQKKSSLSSSFKTPLCTSLMRKVCSRLSTCQLHLKAIATIWLKARLNLSVKRRRRKSDLTLCRKQGLLKINRLTWWGQTILKVSLQTRRIRCLTDTIGYQKIRSRVILLHAQTLQHILTLLTFQPSLKQKTRHSNTTIKRPINIRCSWKKPKFHVEMAAM